MRYSRDLFGWLPSKEMISIFIESMCFIFIFIIMVLNLTKLNYSVSIGDGPRSSKGLIGANSVLGTSLGTSLGYSGIGSFINKRIFSTSNSVLSTLDNSLRHIDFNHYKNMLNTHTNVKYLVKNQDEYSNLICVISSFFPDKKVCMWVIQSSNQCRISGFHQNTYPENDDNLDLHACIIDLSMDLLSFGVYDEEIVDKNHLSVNLIQINVVSNQKNDTSTSYVKDESYSNANCFGGPLS